MNTERPQPDDRIAYFGRVSTPRQKLEHHWEPVERWATANGLTIPDAMKFEDKIRRHESASFFRDWEKRKRDTTRRRYRFDALMELVESGHIDWIVITSFDRWGISHPDECFVFRSKLRDYGVSLFAVVDNLNVTGMDEGSYFHVAAAAVGASRYVEQMAEKNINKMISMTEAGWAGTGNAPFGLDLVLYRLDDVTRPIMRVVRTRYIRPHEYTVVYYSPDSRVERDEHGVITASHLTVERTETAQSMPPRDKKNTGYRYEPSVNTRHTQAVRQMFEMFDAGMTFGAISESLWRQGFKHYDKPFGYHGVETILLNPVYTGHIAWGKNATGEYRVALDKMPVAPKRKKDAPLSAKKDEKHWVRSRNPVFPPIVPPDLFERVRIRLGNRPHVNDSFGKRRIRDKASHALNGKLFCPDCDKPMVLGSFVPGTKTLNRTKGRATKKHCFVCGTYRKSIRTQCHANTVAWDKLDAATTELLKVVSSRIDSVQNADVTVLQQSAWVKQSELGRIILTVYAAAFGQGRFPDAPPTSPIHDEIAQAFQTIFAQANGDDFGVGQVLNQLGIPGAVQIAFRVYDRAFERFAEPLRAELKKINEELDAIADEIPIQRKRNPALAARLDKKALALEARRKELEPQLVPLTDKAQGMLAQLNCVRETIRQSDKLQVALLLESFVDRVYPIFDVQETKTKHPKRRQGSRRATVVGFRFVPKSSAEKVLSAEMKISATRKGRGSYWRTR